MTVRLAQSIANAWKASAFARLSKRADRHLKTVCFICGCGHSGTSLIANMLAGHPRVYIPLRETGIFLGSPGEALAGYQHLAKEAGSAGKDVLLEKTARHIEGLELLRQIVPRAKLLIPVRDGRDVAASIARRIDGGLAEGTQRWIGDNLRVLPERERPGVHVFRYENLIASPQHTLGRICAFLGIEYTAALLDFHQQQRLWFGERDIKLVQPTAHEAFRNWQINQQLFDGRGKWRNEYQDEDMFRFREEPARSIMAAFGYM
jgi:Sulfotransferase family